MNCAQVAHSRDSGARWPSLGALVLAAIFLLAAGAKVLRFTDFLQVVWAFGWLPRALVAPAGAVIVAVEATLAFGLALPSLRRVAAWAATGLLALFTGVAAVAMYQGLAVQCGCFVGLASREIGSALLVQNVLLLLLAGWVARASSRPAARSAS